MPQMFDAIVQVRIYIRITMLNYMTPSHIGRNRYLKYQKPSRQQLKQVTMVCTNKTATVGLGAIISRCGVPISSPSLAWVEVVYLCVLRFIPPGSFSPYLTACCFIRRLVCRQLTRQPRYRSKNRLSVRAVATDPRRRVVWTQSHLGPSALVCTLLQERAACQSRVGALV